MMLINFVIGFFGVLKAYALECMSMINQKCMFRPKIVDVNANEPVFYPYSVRVISVPVVVIISMILLRNCAFLMLLKILMLKCLI